MPTMLSFYYTNTTTSQVIKQEGGVVYTTVIYLIPTGKRLSELSNIISTKAEMTRGPVPSYSDKATNVNGMKDVHVCLRNTKMSP